MAIFNHVDHLAWPDPYMEAQRYWIERNFQEAKNQCGMGEYQARKWRRRHHHIAMVLMAMLFMPEQHLLFKDDYPFFYLKIVN
ncbi:MAG: hypothetical protein PVF37_19870 [Desulfobacterales bacterium]|jgi:SRSO17 transposase